MLKQNRLSCRNLSKAEKERLRAVRESAASGGLKVGGVTTDAVKQMMLLQVRTRRTAMTSKRWGRGCVTPIAFLSKRRPKALNLSLQDALKQSGATEQEIKDILERATKGELSGEAVDDLMTKVLTAKNIARDEFDGMVKLQESIDQKARLIFL